MRTIEVDNEPWFVGKDVAEALGYKDTKSALSDHVDSEDRTIIQRGQITSLETPNRGMTIINESGMYSLILSSKLPSAKEFKRWVTSEILPAIRKTGVYANNRSDSEPNVDTLIKCAEIIAKCDDKNRPYVINILSGIIHGIEDVKSKDNALQLNHTSDKSGNRNWVSRAGYSVPFDRVALCRKLIEENISEYELSTMLNCDANTVRRWIRGENRPGAAYRDKICLALNVRSGMFDHAPNRR